MNVLILILTSASVFSIGGIGEDMAVFRTPFFGSESHAEIALSLKPEFTVLNDGGDFRGVFWTNPFCFSLTVPIAKGFVTGLGNCERYDQSFDVYFEEDGLDIYLDGKGSVDELYWGLGWGSEIGELSFRGSYLFGNSSEVWQYTLANHALIDSFTYKYNGRILWAGARIAFFRISYEFFGEMNMQKTSNDTTITLPSRLSVGAQHTIGNTDISAVFEHSFWPETEGYVSPNRIKISFTRAKYGVSYQFNPWYLNDVVEHKLDFAYSIPIKRFASISLNLGCALTQDDSVREINLVPEIKLTFRELFKRR